MKHLFEPDRDRREIAVVDEIKLEIEAEEIYGGLLLL
ncbi:hypothetical protein SAMN05216226_1272 [Halovenus aranensis]|uniref:Uncharacterized protein n=1 Tax=Halovenus aranensis TaxID=890420 RepID=A0A1G8ZK80_9EURY|nr:hypothetical protein SAMN05216226_1272 [Halovenus aranensis]